MDGDVIIGILMVVFWLLSSLVSRFSKAAKRSQAEAETVVPPVPGASQQATGTFQKALNDLAEQMGLEVQVGPAEPPVASEHSLTASEHRQTVLETHATRSEHVARASEHMRTASETRRTASEAVFDMGEHELTASEHHRGDLRRARLASSAPVKRRGKSLFGKRLAADLRGGGATLGRAVVLREILGPPIGLRSPESEG